MTRDSLALFGLCGALTAFCSLLALMYLSGHKRRFAARLNMIARRKSAEGEAALRVDSSVSLKTFSRFRRRWGIGSRGEAELQARLHFCGYRSADALENFLALRTLTPAAMVLLACFLPGHALLWAVALAGLAYLGPDMFLRRLGSRKRAGIAAGLADTVDLLLICVDAGLGIDQALARVSLEVETVYPEISSELVMVSLEQRAGKARAEAWQDFAARVALDDVNNFVSMLLQTEQFGTPIAKALREFAAGMRNRKAQQAEEQAAKVTVKILFPLALFIFPSIFIILLGPAALSLLKNFSGTVK